MKQREELATARLAGGEGDGERQVASVIFPEELDVGYKESFVQENSPFPSEKLDAYLGHIQVTYCTFSISKLFIIYIINHVR